MQSPVRLPDGSRTLSPVTNASLHPVANCSSRSPSTWKCTRVGERPMRCRSDDTNSCRSAMGKQKEGPMSNSAKRLSQSHEISEKVTQVLQTRTRTALEGYGKRVQGAREKQLAGSVASPMLPWQAATSGAQYAVDFAQRSILFWDTLRQRGNNFLEHARKGFPPVLHFDYEMIMDGRTLKRPVNYALLRII